MWVALESSLLAYTINLSKVFALHVCPAPVQRMLLWFLEVSDAKCRCGPGKSVCSLIAWIISIKTFPPLLIS